MAVVSFNSHLSKMLLNKALKVSYNATQSVVGAARTGRREIDVASFIHPMQKVASTGARRLATSALKEQYPAYVLNAPATEVTTLRNGVRVASEVSPSARPLGHSASLSKHEMLHLAERPWRDCHRRRFYRRWQQV